MWLIKQIIIIIIIIMFMTSIFDVINTINLDVYDVDIPRHKHDQLRCLWRQYSTS